MTLLRFPLCLLSLILACSLVEARGDDLPPLPPFPAIPAPLPQDSVPMGDSRRFPEVKLNLPITSGPFQPTWESIEKNYPGTPAWLREAKFGIWVHFGPQASGRSGDWYARRLYNQGSPAYNNHLKDFGHPSQTGYKDVLRVWNPYKLDPAKLVQIYQDAGARFLIIQGVHHDEFDLWNSKYQPWNATRLGPKRDLLGEWAKAARAAGIRFGVAFHHEYSWWWYQTAFGSDKDGPKAGVPYDGHLTLADGNGKWWQGLDPRLLYGIDLREYKGVTGAANSAWSPPPAGIFTRHLDYAKWYATWWALRMMDVVHNYNPDFIYTDGTSTQPFSGAGTGTGIKADAMQRVIADFYNHALKTRGKVDVFSIVKFRPKTNGTVNTFESSLPGGIKTDQPWIAEAQVGDWFYRPGLYYDAKSMVRNIIEACSRDGAVAICVPLLPDGSLEEGSRKMLSGVGAWMRVNGAGIYGSHAWKILGEGPGGSPRELPGGAIGQSQADFPFGVEDFRFTVGKDGALYAYCMTVPTAGTELRIKTLGSSAPDAKRINSVSLLGSSTPVQWKQEPDALVITYPGNVPDVSIAVGFRITAR
jgi:alpha-L-fucosidase